MNAKTFPFDLGASNDLPFLVGLISITKQGPAELVVMYSGSNDEGSISIAVRQGKKRLTLPLEQYEQVSDWAYRLLEKTHPGWEINEGSSGSLVVDLQTRKVTHEHNFGIYRD